MAGKCELCGRAPMYGSMISHSHRVTNRRFMPNVQHVTLDLNGRRRRVYACTRCIRTMYKNAK